MEARDGESDNPSLCLMIMSMARCMELSLMCQVAQGAFTSSEPD